MVPLVDLQAEYGEIGAKCLTAVEAVARRGEYILGSEVEAFEEDFARYIGVKHCVATSSGTDALRMILRALLIHDVLLPVNTFASVASVIANPTFIDCLPNGAPDSAEAASMVDDYHAYILTHLYGRPTPPFHTTTIVIEDCAQACGARSGGYRVGSMCYAGFFSFYPTKNLGAWGDAGCITTDDGALAATTRTLRDHGRFHSDRHTHIKRGYSARMDAIQAAVLRMKLPHLDEWNARRTRVAAYYDDHLREDIPRLAHNGVFHLYPVRVRERQALRAKLLDGGVQTGLHYPIPLHKQPAFHEHTTESYPVAERLAKETLSLPMHPFLQPNDQDRVIELVNKHAKEYA